MTTDDSLTKHQLMERLNLPSVRMIENLMKARKIPFTRLGHRTVRFDLTRVKTALEKLTVREVSA